MLLHRAFMIYKCTYHRCEKKTLLKTLFTKTYKHTCMVLSDKLQKMCGQKQKNMWSKLKKNTAKKTIIIDFYDDDSDDDAG